MESSVVYVLLPTCVESKYDVFFNLLKNVVGKVGRARLTEYFLDNAFKSGMMNDSIQIDEDDVLLDWTICNSKREGIRHSQLLGHWSTTNCPNFGKVMFGDAWQAPEGKYVMVKTRKGIESFAEDEIERIIFKKMKCHLVQLNVKTTTLSYLKHFVKVPISEVDVENECQVTSKMKTFDIKKNWMDKCWEALKRGAWLSNTQSDIYMKSTSSESVPKRARIDSECVNYTHGSLHGIDTTLSLVKKTSDGNSIQTSDDVPMDLSGFKSNTGQVQTSVGLLAKIEALQSELKEKIGLLAEVQKPIDALKSEFNRMQSSLADLENTNRDFLLQERGKIGSVSDVQKSVVVLQAELKEKKGSLVELKIANQALQLELNRKCELFNESKSELDRKNSSLAVLTKSHHDLQLQMGQENETLADVRKLVVALESELMQKNETLAEFANANQTLQLELNSKNGSLNEMEQLKIEMRQSIVALESELDRKNSSLAVLTKSHHDLQLQMGQENETLADVRKLVVALESELMQKNETLAEFANANQTLQLESNSKNGSLIETGQTKTDITQSIVASESESNKKEFYFAGFPPLELKQKNGTLTEMQESIDVFEFDFDQKSDIEGSTISQLQLQENVRSCAQLSVVPTSSSLEIAQQSSHQEELFESDDPKVKAYRPILLGLKFGWIKFNKKEKYRPGFLHPPDADGNHLAQEVTAEGYPSNEKFQVFSFENNILDPKKAASQIRKVKTLNKKFGFDFN